MRDVSRFQTYELIVPSNTQGSQVNFPDIPLLRSDGTKDVVLLNAEIFSVDTVPLTYSGNTTASLAEIENAFLTLYIEGKNQIYNVPLIRLIQMRGNPGTLLYSGKPFTFNPVRVDWTLSYVTFATPPNNASQFAFLFNFGYEYMPAGAWTVYEARRDNVLSQGIIPVN